jgi:anthranilate phosphoribosyltransferase
MTTLAEIGGWPAVLGPLIDRRDLPASATRAAMAEILEGAASPAQLAGFVVALRMKGETIEELTGLLDAMLDAATLVDVSEAKRGQLVDIVGTGGDRRHTINVSTLASFVVAGAGVPVCKHGNRAASSACGSADLLEALGVELELTPADVARCVEVAGMAFCFAPRFHPALRHAGPARRELGVPTAFNMLGPMANPARVRRMVVGLADPSLAERMLGVLRQHGAIRVLIVHGDDGLDELTTTAPSTVWELDGSIARMWRIEPVELGLTPAQPEQLVGGDAATNARIARAVLAGELGPHRDVVVLNAAAGLLVAGVVEDLAAGVTVASEVLDGGRAAEVLDRLVRASRATPAAGDARSTAAATAGTAPNAGTALTAEAAPAAGTPAAAGATVVDGATAVAPVPPTGPRS